VANYNVDIVVGIKGRQQLDKLTKGIESTLKSVTRLNESAKKFNKVTQSVNSYSTALQKANIALNGAVLGSQNETFAVRQFVNALGLANAARERQNKLIQEQIILNKNNFAAFSKSASGFAIANDPVSKSIRRNQRNQARRANAGSRFRGQSSPLTSPIFPGYSEPIFPGQAQSLFAGGTFRNNLMSNINMSRTGRESSNFGFGSAGDPIAKSIRRNKQKQFKDLLKEKKANKEIRDMKAAQLRLQRSQNRALRQGVLETQNLAKTTKTASSAGTTGGGFFRGGARGAIGSAAIGGGFPLLFGQGALGAVGGGVGGALGGAIGGQFGFSLSIVGTVIAQQIQQAIDFRKEIDKVNTAIKETGGTSTFTASQINSLAKELKMTKDEVLSAVNAFGGFDAAQRTILTQVFGDPSTFKLYASISKDANSLISAIQPLIDANEISITQAQKTLEILNKGGLTEAKVYLENLKEQKELDLEIQKINKVTLEDRQKADAIFKQFFYQDQDGIVRSLGILEKMTEEEQKRYTQMFKAEFFRDERVKALIDENELNKQQTRELLELQRQITEELERQAIIQAPKDELKKLLDPLRQVDALSKSVGASFAESFKGIVRGSMSAQDALRNLFQRTADHFLDMAAQILAAQIRSGIMGLFGNMFGNNFTRNAVSATPTLTPDQQVSRFTFMRANGGVVNAGKSYIVGERGAEMFVPNAGGRIVPNSDLGGSTNIVVNVDASGSSVEGDEEQGRELGRMISVAIQSELIKQKRPGGMLA
jgi:hypothetical protein